MFTVPPEEYDVVIAVPPLFPSPPRVLRIDPLSSVSAPPLT